MFRPVLILGTLPSVCHADGADGDVDHLHSRGIKLFDFAIEFVQPFREPLRAQAKRVAADVRSTPTSVL